MSFRQRNKWDYEGRVIEHARRMGSRIADAETLLEAIYESTERRPLQNGDDLRDRIRRFLEEGPK